MIACSIIIILFDEPFSRKLKLLTKCIKYETKNQQVLYGNGKRTTRLTMAFFIILISQKVHSETAYGIVERYGKRKAATSY